MTTLHDYAETLIRLGEYLKTLPDFRPVSHPMCRIGWTDRPELFEQLKNSLGPGRHRAGEYVETFAPDSTESLGRLCFTITNYAGKEGGN